MDIKKNIPLIVGLTIPVLMIIFVAASIYLPGRLAKPGYDFVYVTGDEYLGGQQYSVKGETLVYTEPLRSGIIDFGKKPMPQLYLHDMATNQSRDITFEEAAKLKLDPNKISADGYEIVNGTQEGGVFPFLLFAERDYGTLYVKGHNASKKLNTRLGNQYYNWRFLGWVKK